MFKLIAALVLAFLLYVVRADLNLFVWMHDKNLVALEYLSPSRTTFLDWLDDGYLLVILYVELIFIVWVFFSLIHWVVVHKPSRRSERQEPTRSSVPEGHGGKGGIGGGVTRI